MQFLRSSKLASKCCHVVFYISLHCGRNNETILNTLESEKLPYLISSDSLVKLLTCTTSVKTRLTMILNVAPRLSDPRAKMSTFTDMFRFSEEKTQIEDAFKARIQAMNGSMFRRETSNMLSPAGRGGRGRGAALSPGRGDFGGGRGAGALLTNKPRAVSLPVGQKLELPADGVGSQRSTDKDSDDDDDDDNGQCPASSHRPFSMVITPTVFSKVEETGTLSAAADSKN